MQDLLSNEYGDAHSDGKGIYYIIRNGYRSERNYKIGDVITLQQRASNLCIVYFLCINE